MLKKIGHRLIILGGGRWGQITYNNLCDINEVCTLELISRTLKLNFSILKKKNIQIRKNFNINFVKQFDLIIICKDNFSNLKYLKKIINFKNIVVVEKPLIIKNNLNTFLTKFKKKNFFISLPWFFEDILKKRIYNYLSNLKSDRIKIFWYDKPDKKFGLEKKFDTNINYAEDIFSHIFSLLYNKKNKNLIKFDSFEINKNIEHLSFYFDYIKVDLDCSYKINKSLKKIVFFKDKKVISKVNLNYKNFYIKDYIENKNFLLENKSDNLIKQYKFLLGKKNLDPYKDICNKLVYNQHYLNKLCKKSQR